MSIVRRTPPAHVAALIRTGLIDISAGKARMLGGAMPIELTEALPLYGVDTDHLLRGQGTAALVQVGWRSIVTDDKGQRLFADVDGVDSDAQFARVAAGPAIGRLIERAELSERELAGGEAELELRLFESPQLKIAALWLAGPTTWFLPYSGSNTKILSEDAFLELLTERARERRAKFSDEPIDLGRWRARPEESEEGESIEN